MYGYLTVKLALVVIALASVAVRGGRAAIGRARARRRLREAPTEVSDRSMVTVSGVVRALDPPLVAPLSGTECVLHQSRARVYTPRGWSSLRRGGRAIEREVVKLELVPFVLVTETGEVIVDGDRAELTCRPWPIVPRKLERERAFLDAAGLAVHPSAAGFDEIVVAPGTRVSVHGLATIEIAPDAGGEAGFRTAPQRVRLVGDAAHPLTIRIE
ncbi:MAG TPA: hypothetical protein VLX92_34760 [Kofleriaceae bacterium]|nr:hypothetical protein [Kofleriaceae bacterium]